MSGLKKYCFWRSIMYDMPRAAEENVNHHQPTNTGGYSKEQMAAAFMDGIAWVRGEMEKEKIEFK